MLRDAALRVTRPRVAVLSAVHDHPHADIDCLVGRAPCLTPSDDSGYQIDAAEVTHWGRCPRCVAAPPAASGG
jgi:Fe2+ or Zn2+ uptake regulation protein